MVKRRERRYTDRFNIGLDSAMASRIREASERYGIAESMILRKAIAGGLKNTIDAIRKQSAGRTE